MVSTPKCTTHVYKNEDFWLAKNAEKCCLFDALPIGLSAHDSVLH